MNAMTKGILAELIGTFTLVFIGGLAVVVTGVPDANANVVVPALAHGLILVGIIFAFASYSGAQFNPAISVGLLVGGKQSVADTAIYIVAQVVGAIIAAFVIVAVLPDPGNYGQTTGSLTADNVWNAAVIEAILAFFLVTAVYQAAVFGKAGKNAALAIGLTLAACIFAGGVFTGASVNPARTLGPAIAAAVNGGADISYVVPYLIGLFAGGIVGGVVHAFVLTPDEEAS